MRYAIRLVDQNLPGLTRELALTCWRSVDALLPERPGTFLYRELYRAVQGVLRARLEAFRYCGETKTCAQSLGPMEIGGRWTGRGQAEPGRIHTYLIEFASTPEQVAIEILRATLKAVVAALPQRRLKGVARLLRRQIEKTLRGRVFFSEMCGDQPICKHNEAYDPWDLSDRQNAVVRAGA
jgi:hypothetical protein